MKKNYLIFLIVLGLITLSVYSTYAMFTASIDTGDIVNLTSSTLPVDTKLVEYERLTINAGDTKTIKFTVSNSTTSTKYYGVWYEMIKPTSITDGIQIAKSPDTTSDTFGSLNANTNVEVLLVVENLTDSSVIINIGVGYSDTNSLNLPTDRYLITEEYVESNTNVNIATYLTNLYNTGTATIEQDAGNGTEYEYRKDISMMTDIGGNIRYYGPDPDNYVMFNDEQWRIIGVFNNIDDGTGNKETRVKIIKAEVLTGTYAWNSTSSCNSSGGSLDEYDFTQSIVATPIATYYCNNWTTATAPVYLNETYLSELTTEARNMIGEAIWNTGGSSTSSLYADGFYSAERSNNAYSTNIPTTWKGKVTLMYPSDYMYAGDLMACAKTGNNWAADQTNCRDKSWLYSTSVNQWTLMPNSGTANDAFYVYYNGNLGNTGIRFGYGFRPTLYLKSNVSIDGGSGKDGDEYTLTCEGCN